MNILVLLLAASYLGAGQFCFSRIVISELIRNAYHACRDAERESARFTLAQFHNWTLAGVILKASFMLFWPIFLLYGFLSARWF
ncbi:hypothetical protein CLV78_1253 [Aliiruegeria haliotis]|uniref:Uncharacterized protein n=1 Tax=Aliiruegeria haliotis TaxID=1280846 RepID=A0A2T0RDP3_9RHOB|nr:hypothetical protein [Aliiruegeria haliotis]PRY19287.1 hypothetical protein CLV78_1253 [Aliiruegeria haliotis]